MRSSITFRTVFKYSVTGVFVLCFVAYTLFQARFLLAGPRLSLSNEPNLIQQERVILLEGQAKNIVKITLNGREIYTDKNGYFKEELVLENGYTITTLEGTDRFGRRTTLSRNFVYQPKDLTEDNQP